MGKMFLGGMPTEFDVKKLLEAFPSIKEGDTFEHGNVEQIIGVTRNSSRYKSITQAWRKNLLRNENKQVDAIPGFGFKCMSPDERISGGVKGMNSGVKKIARSCNKALRVTTQDPALKSKQDHMQRFGAFIHNEANRFKKEIAPPQPTQQIPLRPMQEVSA